METSKNISNASQSCCELVASSLDAFKPEMHNHDDINKFLAGQCSFFTSSGDAHKVEIDEQKKNLSEQKEVYIDDREISMTHQNHILRQPLNLQER